MKGNKWSVQHDALDKETRIPRWRGHSLAPFEQVAARLNKYTFDVAIYLCAPTFFAQTLWFIVRRPLLSLQPLQLSSHERIHQSLLVGRAQGDVRSQVADFQSRSKSLSSLSRV